MAKHFSSLYCAQPEYVWTPESRRERVTEWLWRRRVLWCLLGWIGGHA